MLINFAWRDRDNGTYTIEVDDVSLGSFTATSDTDADNEINATAGVDPAYLLFDSLQSGASKVEIIIAGTDSNAPALAEVTFYTVPEPGSLALLAAGGLFVLRRRRG